MKLFSLLVLSTLVAGVASADPVVRDHRTDPRRPVPAPAPAPVPAPMPQPLPDYSGVAHGRVHRLALTLNDLAERTATVAKQLFDTGMYGDRLTDEEVDAIAQLKFVSEMAQRFRVAVTNEQYEDNQTHSQQEYMWLHRAYSLVERNRAIMSRAELNGYVAQMTTVMQQLRQFQELVRRYSWSLAEIILIGEEFEAEVINVYSLAQREVGQVPPGRDHRDPRNRDPRGDRDERQFLGQLMRLQGAARQFVSQARLYNNTRNARYGLQDEFTRLRQTYQAADWRMDRLNFSPAVKQSFNRVSYVYGDLELSFTNGR